jgi:hypothetical protein
MAIKPKNPKIVKAKPKPRPTSTAKPAPKPKPKAVATANKSRGAEIKPSRGSKTRSQVGDENLREYTRTRRGNSGMLAAKTTKAEIEKQDKAGNAYSKARGGLGSMDRKMRMDQRAGGNLNKSVKEIAKNAKKGR